MNSIGNITFINQNQTTASTHIANKMANEDTQVVLNAQLSQENKELKGQDVGEVEVENKVDDYLKEQKQNANNERKKKKNTNKNDDDKQNKSKINDNNDFVDFSDSFENTSVNGIFSSMNVRKNKQIDKTYEPLDIKA